MSWSSSWARQHEQARATADATKRARKAARRLRIQISSVSSTGSAFSLGDRRYSFERIVHEMAHMALLDSFEGWRKNPAKDMTHEIEFVIGLLPRDLANANELQAAAVTHTLMMVFGMCDGLISITDSAFRNLQQNPAKRELTEERDRIRTLMELPEVRDAAALVGLELGVCPVWP